MTLTVTAGTVYRLRVAGFFGDEGSIVLNWNPATTTSPPNDLFSNAQTISGPSGRVTGSNLFATDETGEPRIRDQFGVVAMASYFERKGDNRHDRQQFRHDFGRVHGNAGRYADDTWRKRRRG